MEEPKFGLLPFNPSKVTLPPPVTPNFWIADDGDYWIADDGDNWVEDFN